MGVEDDDLSALEERMRAKLQPERKVEQPRLGAEDQRIARRLLGTANAERIANAKEGRRVRVAPVRITYEWYWFRYGGGYSNEHWCWRINRIENGHRREQHAEGTDPEQLAEVLAALRDMGIVPVDANGDLEPAKPKQPTISKRKAIINSLRFYRP